MKILLFGKNGQVGWELQRSLATLGELVTLDRASVPHCGDLTHLDGVADAIRAIQPGIIVNAAAYTAVDRAETEPELCRRINALAPQRMAMEAERMGAWLVHYSTDYVFDGSGTTPWAEDDAISPINVYGQSKAEGETAVVGSCSRYLQFRTSWVYAGRGSNFIRTMLRLGQERERLTVVDDQHGAPTGADLIADVTAHALRAALEPGRASLAGTYHLAAAGQTSWHDYAAHVFACARERSVPCKAALVPVGSDEYKTPARRPHNSRLNTDKLKRTFGLHLPHWTQGVERAVASLT